VKKLFIYICCISVGLYLLFEGAIYKLTPHLNQFRPTRFQKITSEQDALLWRFLIYKRNYYSSDGIQNIAKIILFKEKKELNPFLFNAKLFLYQASIKREWDRKELIQFFINNIDSGSGKTGLNNVSRFYFNKSFDGINATELKSLLILSEHPDSPQLCDRTFLEDQFFKMGFLIFQSDSPQNEITESINAIQLKRCKK